MKNYIIFLNSLQNLKLFTISYKWNKFPFEIESIALQQIKYDSYDAYISVIYSVISNRI